MNARAQIVADMVQVVYGSREIVIARGPRPAMEAYRDRMNTQAPQYEHRIKEE